jgi:hypothetical protein
VDPSSRTRGHNAVVNLLLAYDGIDPDFKSNYGRTPLSMAAANGPEGVIKPLLAQDGVDPGPKESHGTALISRAAANEHEAVVNVARSRQVYIYWLWKHCLLLSILPGGRANTYTHRKMLSVECLTRANSWSLSS